MLEAYSTSLPPVLERSLKFCTLSQSCRTIQGITSFLPISFVLTVSRHPNYAHPIIPLCEARHKPPVLWKYTQKPGCWRDGPLLSLRYCASNFCTFSQPCTTVPPAASHHIFPCSWLPKLCQFCYCPCKVRQKLGFDAVHWVQGHWMHTPCSLSPWKRSHRPSHWAVLVWRRGWYG